MLNIKDISLSYDKKEVLKGLSLQVVEGKVMGVLGRNGAGKTSLFNCLYGHIKASGGQSYFHAAPLSAKHIAYLETHPYFYNYITGKEYLQLCSHKNPDFDIKQWNQVFALPLEQYVSSYSTGMRKQIAFLGILALNRPLLILDEPFNGLDFESSEKMYQIIRRLKKHGKTILISSHIIETLTNTCDEIAYLQNGMIQKIYHQSSFTDLKIELRDKIQAEVDKELDFLF